MEEAAISSDFAQSSVAVAGVAERIRFNPDQIPSFGEADPDSVFVLITNTPYLDSFDIEPSRKYASTRILAFDHGQSLPDYFADGRIPEGSHVLTILPDCLCHSIPRQVLGRRKLLIMACRSGQTGLDGVAHFLRGGEKTDPARLEAFAAEFFRKGEAADVLELVDDRYGTRAIFHHMQDCLEWHEQFGLVEWGGQQVYPGGEIACFVVPLKIQELDPRVTFEVDGQLALRGVPIVQSGPPSFLLSDQERIFRRLATMRDHAVIVDIRNGDVVDLRASDPACQPAADMLLSLFDVDSRFRRIYEIGFAINTAIEPFPGNTAMNEVYGGSNGQVHVGLGMLPHSQYHLDINCAGTKVLGKGGEVIFGGEAVKAGRMRRQRVAACPCTVF